MDEVFLTEKWFSLGQMDGDRRLGAEIMITSSTESQGLLGKDKNDDKDIGKDDDYDDVDDNDYMMIITVIANSDRQSRMHRELTMSIRVDKSGENGKKEIQTCREI